jgi:uncharacterized LabA/DUF88 family protein
MKKKVAVLVDGEWFRRRLEQAMPSLPNGITADLMYRHALAALDLTTEELFRLFYYDCPPFEGIETNPIDGAKVEFKKQSKYQARTLFLKQMGQKEYVALRLGQARNRGWTLKDNYIRRSLNGTHNAPSAADVFVSLEQKGVDMRIGIDVATLALKSLVNRIVLISGDTDMVPAMKLARREGVQVVLVDVAGCGKLHRQLIEDSDVQRTVTPTP